jgi:hypothetical protein
MANEEQYINPIIQAMVHSATLQANAAHLEAQKKQNESENKLRQQQNDLAEKRLEEEHQQHLDMLNKIHLPMLNAQLAAHKINTIEELRKVAQGGGDLGQIFPAGQPQQNLPNLGNVELPGPELAPKPTINVEGVGQNIPPEAFGTPEGALKLMEGQARAKASGEAAGELPYQKELSAFKTDQEIKLKKTEEAFTSSENQKKLEQSLKIANMDDATKRWSVGVETNARTKLFGLEHGLSSDMIRSGITQASLGQLNLNADDPFHRVVRQAITEAGGRPLDPKEAEVLKGSNQLKPYLDKLKDWANTYLPSEKEQGAVGAGAEAMAQGFLMKTPIPTDAKNKLEQIKSGAFNIAKQIDNNTNGRMPMQQVQLVLDSFANPGVTREMALDKANFLDELYGNKIANTIEAGTTREQQNMIYKAYKVTPAWLTGAGKINAAGMPLDVDKSIEVGKPVYGR